MDVTASRHIYSVSLHYALPILLQDVTESVPALVTDFEKRQAPSLNISAMEARANALANGEIPDATAMPLVESDTDAADETAAGATTPEETIEYDVLPGEDEVDPVLLDIFENETETHLQTIKEYLE